MVEDYHIGLQKVNWSSEQVFISFSIDELFYFCTGKIQFFCNGRSIFDFAKHIFVHCNQCDGGRFSSLITTN